VQIFPILKVFTLTWQTDQRVGVGDLGQNLALIVYGDKLYPGRDRLKPTQPIYIIVNRDQDLLWFVPSLYQLASRLGGFDQPQPFGNSRKIAVGNWRSHHSLRATKIGSPGDLRISRDGGQYRYEQYGRSHPPLPIVRK
jgi:hypothetical protein